MRLSGLILLLFIVCNSYAQTKPNVLSASERRAGWTLLFDGKTTHGWHRFNSDKIGSAWKVSNGSLYLDTSSREGWQIKDGGDIVTSDSFGDFHLKIDWKIAPGGNSGIMFYVQEHASLNYPWLTGPEMQILDNDRHPDGKIISHRAGDLYDLVKSTSEPVHPAGVWNHAEIISQKGVLILKMNGVEVVRTTLWDAHWASLIAGSKFHDMPLFGRFHKGKIALQDHGNLVWFRNIKIRRL